MLMAMKKRLAKAKLRSKDLAKLENRNRNNFANRQWK